MAQQSSLAARLTRKVGPLPVWGWAVAILGAYLLYTRLHGSSAATGSTPATPTTDTTGADTGATGSSSTPSVSPDLLGALDTNTATVDALTSQLLSMPGPYSPLGDPTALGQPVPVPTDTGGGVGPAARPTTAPPPLPPAAHPTQTTAGVLRWGGLTFTTKSAFDAWARSHGTTTTRELSNHPQARAIYSTLR